MSPFVLPPSVCPLGLDLMCIWDIMKLMWVKDSSRAKLGTTQDHFSSAIL